MRFSYYERLGPKQKAIYRASDAVETLRLPDRRRCAPAIAEIQAALEDADRAGLNRACQELCDRLTAQFEVDALRITVLAARPSHDWGELQGLYESSDGESEAAITVWMRTAQRRKVVAFKTFLRTVLHELLHHLDYELLELADSYHTQGFFKRESSLFHQLVEKR